jgi:type III secretion protein S
MFSYRQRLFCPAPFLVVAAGLGLLIGLIQGVTQIQDQTLPLTIKIIAAIFMMIAMGANLSIPLYQQSVEVFSTFHIKVQ